MPNTKPVNDQRAVTELIVRRAREVGAVRVRPIGAITQGLEGKMLADIADMKEAGIVAISDDGRPVMNAGLMRRAFEYASTFDLPVVQHAEDLDLAEGGAMNEGAVSTRIGIKGQPACAESAMVARDLEIVEWTGARYHVAHVSTARTVALVRDAKRRGLPVTCEVTPHHLALTDEACSHYDTRTKVMPPLRTAADQEALLEALADGTIDAIATDHAPHSPVEKDVEFECAAPGMLGLETALPIILDFVRMGTLDDKRAIAALTGGPARAFGLPGGALAVGAVADICVIDPERPLTITADGAREQVEEHAVPRPDARRARGAHARRGPRASTTSTGGCDDDARWPAALVLENGRVFRGEGFGARNESRSARSCSTRRSPATRRSSAIRRTPGRSS